MEQPLIQTECDHCLDNRFEAVMCCSGLREMCGCMGMPIDFKPCQACNHDGSKEPSETLKAEFPHFFGR